MDSSERRRHERHDLKLDVLCQKVGVSDMDDEFFSGRTLNVSTGGMLAESKECEVKIGDLLNVYLSVPPTQGLLETGGRFESHAKVTRIYAIKSHGVGSKAQVIAMQFCSSPKLSV